MKNKLIESIENAYGELWNGLQGTILWTWISIVMKKNAFYRITVLKTWYEITSRRHEHENYSGGT